MSTVDNKTTTAPTDHSETNGEQDEHSNPGRRRQSDTLQLHKHVDSLIRRRHSDGAHHVYTADEREQIERIKQRLEQNMALNLLSLPRHTDRPKSPGADKLSEFQRTKFDYMFDTLYGPVQSDAVSRDDFWKLLKTAVKIRDWSPLHPGFRDLQTRMASIWAGLIKGTLVYKPDGNALVMEIKREEWHNYWGDFVEAAVLCGGNWPEKSKDQRIDYQCQRDFKDFMFTLLDVNGDGAIDKPEYIQCLSAFGIWQSDSEESFERIQELLPRSDHPASKFEKYIQKTDDSEDTDQPSRFECVTESDFDQLWFQYLTSNDRLHPGNYILGPSPIYL